MADHNPIYDLVLLLDASAEDATRAKIVADAWCQAHGLGGAKHFGPAIDITGAISKTSVKTAAVKPVREDDVYISCGE